jgi:hypothetical protein
MEMRGGPKHVHASRDGLAVVDIVQQRLRDVDDPQQLRRLRAELEHGAHSPEHAGNGAHLGNVIQLRANMRHRLIHAQ